MEEVSTSPPSPGLWGGTCWPTDSGLLLAGGMDELFLSSPSTFLLSYPGLQWAPGPYLPRAASGALGANMGPQGSPMLWGGYGVGFYHRDVLGLVDGEGWQEVDTRLDNSRVSGLAVTVPSDLWTSCN